MAAIFEKLTTKDLRSGVTTASPNHYSRSLPDVMIKGGRRGEKTMGRELNIAFRAMFVAVLSAAAAITLSSPAGAITPDEWGMDDGIGVGPRVVGASCLASEAHEWATNANGGRYALWCPPPAFVWVSVK